MKNSTLTMDKETQKNINNWLQGNYDKKSQQWIRETEKNSPSELVDAFYQRLSFGTGGLRGKMGVGTNRMNIYTVRGITQALANHINKQPRAALHQNHRVVIGYDSRHHSKEFAFEAARVLAFNTIEVWLYSDIHPVPLVSFGVLHKQATAGIMITASHNPPQYNGYKVYWSNGVQVLPPHDLQITAEFDAIDDLSKIQLAPVNHNLIHIMDNEIDQLYMKTITSLSVHAGQNHSHGNQLHIVYTPLHGTGIKFVPDALTAWGFSKVTLVESQVHPDGDFPTVKVPNPEEPEALKLGIDTLKSVKADILIANDPDADRIAVVELIDGKPFLFNGNEMACLLLDHVLKSNIEAKILPPKPMCIKTIVTSELFSAIADHYKVGCQEVLTGFKYIGEKISQWEDDHSLEARPHHFLFGGEESFGYLWGTHVRDKDGVVIAALVAEAALAAKLQGKTLKDHLYSIYHRHGVFREHLVSIAFEGKAGMERMHTLMQNLRTSPLKTIQGTKVVTMEDYLFHARSNFEAGTHEPILLPKSDVIRLFLADKTTLVIRPSGTEPKLKIYCGAMEKHFISDAIAIERAIHECDKKVKGYLNFLEQHFR